MKKLRRLLFRLLLFTIVILLGIFTINTIAFSSKQIAVQAVEKPGIDPDSKLRLSGVIQIPTVSYPERIDTTNFLSLHRFLDSNYVYVDSLLEKFPINTYSRVYKWQGRKSALKPILLMAHMDIVPVEKEGLNKWTEHPYSGKIENGFIWGRGTLDDKVSILGLLEAIELLLVQGYQPQRSVYLAFGHDEEISGRNGAKAIATWFKKQNIEFEYVLDEGSIILENALPGMDAPLAIVGNSEKGYMTATLNVRLDAGGHSSMPPKQTAIGILSNAIACLEANPCPAKFDGSVRSLLDYAGPEMNFPYRSIFANLWFFKGILKKQFSNKPSSSAVLRTTIAPTILQSGVKENVLPTEAMAKVNFRILPGETTETVVDYVKKTIDDDRVEISIDEGESYNPSKVSATGVFGFNVIQKTIGEVFPGVVTAPGLVIATTDSRHFQEVSDHIYRFLPVQLNNEDLKRIHGIDERISVENYERLIQFYHQLLLNSTK